MRFTSKGIGWLIAGAVIGATALDSDDLISAAGTLLIGLTLAAVYLMKQRFEPKGTGWFIAGGIMTAFTVEMALGEFSRIVRITSLDGSDLSTVLIGAIISCACFFAFYRNNVRGVHELAAEMGIDIPEPAEEEPAEEQTAEKQYAETHVEPVSGGAAGTAAEAVHSGSEVEFELETAGEDRKADKENK